MKLTVAKKMALLVVAALFGILLSNGIALYQTNKVFESANYGNVALILDVQGLVRRVAGDESRRNMRPTAVLAKE